MHKRIIMLAKIALIIAAAQIHITAANFISAQTNTSSNATHAMSNDEEQTIFQAFKNEIESNEQQQTNTSLSIDDPKNLEQKIQNFIKDDEEKALALYIANQWDLIKELGWKRDEVYNYVQRCLSGLYNSTKDDPTIQVGSKNHKGIAAAIENLNKQPIGNNRLRALLKDILHPAANKSNLETVLEQAEGHDLTQEKKELTPDEEKLIRITNNCADKYMTPSGKTNEKTQQLTGLITQLIYLYLMPISDSDLKWIQDNKNTINTLIERPDNDLQTLTNKAIKNPKNAESYKKMAHVRPDLVLIHVLRITHLQNLVQKQHQEQEDKEMLELAQQLKPNIAKAFLSSDENGAKQTTATQPTPEQQLLKEFLNFIMGWEIPQQTSNNNRSTIFKEAAEKIQQAAHKITSIKTTQKQKDLLKLIKIAYSTIKITTIGELRKGKPHKSTCPAKDQTIYKIYIETYEQILNKILDNDEIQPIQIHQDLTKHITELQQVEYKLKEQEEARRKEEAKRKQEEARRKEEAKRKQEEARREEEEKEKRKKEERAKREQEERKSYAQAFQIIADMLIAQPEYEISRTTARPVLRNLCTYAEKIRDAISNNTINKDGKTIEMYLEDLFEAAYSEIDDSYDGPKQLIKEVILPQQQQQSQTQDLEPNKEQTEFKIKQLLLLIRLIAQVERGQFYADEYKEVSSGKEGPTQQTSPSNNLQGREQDESLLNEYHITHPINNEGTPKEQHITFYNISLKQLNISSHLLQHTLYTLYKQITEDASLANVDAKAYANVFDKILLILNKDILNEETNKKTDVQNTNANSEEQIIIKQNNQICSKLEEYINKIPYWDRQDWKATTQRYIKQLQWIIQRITKEELSKIPTIPLDSIKYNTQYCLESLQARINNQTKREQEEEKEKRNKEEERKKKEEREELSNPFTPAWKLIQQTTNYCIKKLQAKINNQKREKEEQARKRKAKAQGSKISTTQKIINNLSATNKMLQIIMQILY